MKKSLSVALLGATFAALATGAQAQDDGWSDVEIKAEHLRGGLYVLFGRGGNIGLSVGDDGAILVDDQYAPLTDKIKAAIAGVTDKPLRFVINTHFHNDHSGGNENLGDSAVIVAHDNVRQRLSEGAFIKAFNNRMPPQPAVALPVVTFNSEMSLHVNGDDARIIHAPNAHTDGDSFIWFKSQNVMHMGDLMFNGMFPFIDVPNGGSVGGVLTALDRAIAMADGETIVIPGHGKVTDKAGLIAYRATLGEMTDIVAALKAEGNSLEAVQAMNPLAAYKEKLIQFSDTWADQFVGFVYESL
jgi:glyoxylase-like metal-dependent hydrolase (beta-lactamase superfamily II)